MYPSPSLKRKYPVTQSSFILKALYQIIKNNISIMKKTPQLKHRFDGKRGRPMSDNHINDQITALRQCYKSTANKNRYLLKTILNLPLETQAEKNALGLAYASFGYIMIHQLNKMWPTQWKERYQNYAKAISYFAKAVFLDNRNALTYLNSIKIALDKIKESSFYNFLEEKITDPWLIKGIDALITHYEDQGKFDLATYYAQISDSHLGIQIYEKQEIETIPDDDIIMPLTPPLEDFTFMGSSPTYIPSLSSEFLPLEDLFEEEDKLKATPKFECS